MIYLLLGEDSLTKDAKVEAIRAKLLPNNEALKFDYEVLHAHKLSAEDLKKALVSLPAVALKRLVVLRTLQKCSPAHKKIILEFIDSEDSKIDLILDSDDAGAPNAFIKKISAKAKVFHFKSDAKSNVFDMTKAMTARKPSLALKILADLIGAGQHPLQIMGGLVWFWGNKQRHLPQAKFSEGLKNLKETDLNIKRSKCKPEYAMEVLVVKLCSLIAY